MADFSTERDLQKISPMLKEEILLNVLKEVSGENNIRLKSYTLRSLSDQGFLSIVSRIQIEGTTFDGSNAYSVGVIVKALPHNICHKKSFKLPEFFKNEVMFYTKVFDKMMAFQKKKNPKKAFNSIPRCFKAYSDGDNDFIILEDLNMLGFQSVKRQEMCDFEHCSEILKCLGRFHGLSLAMKDQEPDEFKAFVGYLTETYFSEAQRKWYEGMLKKILDYSALAVSIQYPNSEYEERMKEFCQSAVYEKAIELVQPEMPRSVISNGDTWLPNFLFKYDHLNEKHIKDIRLIDFQISRCSNPVFDISLFMYTCTSKEFRDSNASELLRIYHQNLSNMIEDLGSDPKTVYPYETFEKDIKDYSVVGFISAMDALPVSMMEENELPKLDLLEGDKFIPMHEIWKFPPLHNEKKIKRLADNVVYAIDNKHI